jgi:UDP-N-acetylmuramate dehydrogenase
MIASHANAPGYRIIENAPLAGRNSLRVPARAHLLIDVTDAAVLPTLLDLPALQSRLLVLGEGSNVLFVGDWPGVVLGLATRGIGLIEDRGDGAVVRVEAGENWHDLVQWSLAHGLAGLENLALIPGSVGAAPIQNIGAYGVEVGEFIAHVEAFDRHARATIRLSQADCAFAYRDSRFKREPDRYIVTAVELLLPRTRELVLGYAGVREELAAMNLDAGSHIAVAEAVMRLRTRKLPNPALIGNAGSFFKNPLVPASLAQELQRTHPALPVWPTANGLDKLSAAWLIEACGFKGVREGAAGVSEQHALVLVNHGGASGAQLWALAQRIIQTVRTRFGIVLEPEPRILGA